MKLDERGLALSTDSEAAVTSFDRAVEHYLKFHADTMALANNALIADPHFVMGHCLKAYLLLMAETNNIAQMRRNIGNTNTAKVATHITPRKVASPQRARPNCSSGAAATML